MSEQLPEPAGADQIEAFANDLDRLIDRYIDEFDISAAALIGALQMAVIERTMLQFSDTNDDENQIQS